MRSNGAKQFYVRYESDERILGGYEHTAGNASTLKIAKSVIRNVRRWDAEHNPRNFKVYDCYGSDENGGAPCVYSEP